MKAAVLPLKNPEFDYYDSAANLLKIHHYPEFAAHLFCAALPPFIAAFELTASVLGTFALTRACEKVGIPFPPALRKLALLVLSPYSLYAGFCVGAKLADRVSNKIEETNRPLTGSEQRARNRQKKGLAPIGASRQFRDFRPCFPERRLP